VWQVVLKGEHAARHIESQSERLVMTTVHERTRSVVQTRDFLRELANDNTLPETLRTQARVLLRHYPTPEQIWQAGRLEEHRRAKLCLMEEKNGPLPPVLGLWLASDFLFCDQRSTSKVDSGPGPSKAQ